AVGPHMAMSTTPGAVQFPSSPTAPTARSLPPIPPPDTTRVGWSFVAAPRCSTKKLDLEGELAMLASSFIAFDEIVAGTVATCTAYQIGDTLGRFDRLAFLVLADTVSGTSPTLTVAIEHSGDGRNFVAKNGTPEVNGVALSARQTNVVVGADTGATRSQGFVRLRVQLGGSSPQAHVRIMVTIRDRKRRSRRLRSGLQAATRARPAAFERSLVPPGGCRQGPNPSDGLLIRTPIPGHQFRLRHDKVMNVFMHIQTSFRTPVSKILANLTVRRYKVVCSTMPLRLIV